MVIMIKSNNHRLPSNQRRRIRNRNIDYVIYFCIRFLTSEYAHDMIFRILSKYITTRAMSSAVPNPLPKHVYKIYPDTAVYQGTPIPIPSHWEFPQTQVDLDDGFIHLSTSAQLAGTLSRFFKGDERVQLLKIDFARLSAWKKVKWDLASNGEVFPHLYAQLTGEFVKEIKVVAQGGDWEKTVENLKEQRWVEV